MEAMVIPKAEVARAEQSAFKGGREIETLNTLKLKSLVDGGAPIQKIIVIVQEEEPRDLEYHPCHPQPTAPYKKH